MTETQRPERKDWSASILLAMSVVFLDAKKRLLTQNFIRNEFFAVKDTAHCKQGCLRSSQVIPVEMLQSYSEKQGFPIKSSSISML